MFQLTHNEINDKIVQDYFTQMNLDDCGALVNFWGIVRNHNEGKSVLFLEYEAYQEMAVKVGQNIINEIKQKYPIVAAACIHRVGKLNVGENAVVVAVYSHHREEAFRACSEIINRIKIEVPIWKNEFYHNHSSHWVNCPHCEKHAHD